MRRISVAIAVSAALVSRPQPWPLRAVERPTTFCRSTTRSRVSTTGSHAPAEFAEIEALVAAQDANGDDQLCSKQFGTNQGRDKQWIGPDGDFSDYIVTMVIDNKAVGRGS